MNMRSFSVKFTLFVAYFFSILFIVCPIFLIITVIYHRNLIKKENKFYEELKRIGFNNYAEIETGQYKYLIFNSDGRFIETLHQKYRIFDIRDYIIEFNLPNQQNQVLSAILAQKVAGDLAALSVIAAGQSYLVLRKKGELSNPLKYRIAGKKSVENLLNFLFYYKEKGFIS